MPKPSEEIVKKIDNSTNFVEMITVSVAYIGGQLDDITERLEKLEQLLPHPQQQNSGGSSIAGAGGCGCKSLGLMSCSHCR